MLYQRIHYFLAAAERGSFSAAANHLYISPQALTKQIGMLEKDLGGALFERSRQGITLTRFGSYAYEKLQGLEQQQKSVIEDLKRQAKEQKERIRIGVFSSLPQDTVVSPVISFLLGAHQEFQFHLELVELKEGQEMMRAGQLDMLLSNIHEQEAWSGFGRLSFASFPAEVIVSLLHPWAIKDEITKEDLRQETFLKMDMDNNIYTMPTKESFYENVPCAAVRKIRNFNTMYALLQQGDAFAVFPRAYSHMDTARVKYFDYPGQTLWFHTALIYRPDAKITGWMDLINNMKDEFDLVEMTEATMHGENLL